MKKRYIAYGSNMDERQMAHRCPTARLLGQTSGAAMVALLFHIFDGETTVAPMFVAAGFAATGAVVSASRIRLPLPEALRRR